MIVFFAFEGIALAMFAFCFIGPNNKIKINVLTILDALLCYVLICFYPYHVSILLFNYNREIYYLLGIIFSALPFISDMFSNINISFSTIRRILTRALMVLTMIIVCLSMLSCSPNIG
jgi:hypothetical protein